MIHRLFLSVILGMTFPFCFTGCGGKPELLREPVDVSGKVTKPDGSPLAGASITFRPFSLAHPMTFKTDKEGNFKGQLVPGKFMYFIPDDISPNMVKGVDAKFMSPSEDRSIEVAAGATLNIELR